MTTARRCPAEQRRRHRSRVSALRAHRRAPQGFRPLPVGISNGVGRSSPRPRMRALPSHRPRRGQRTPRQPDVVGAAARGRGRRARHARAAAQSWNPLDRNSHEADRLRAGRCRRGCAPSTPRARRASRTRNLRLAPSLERRERVRSHEAALDERAPCKGSPAPRGDPRTRLRSARRSPASAARARTREGTARPRRGSSAFCRKEGTLVSCGTEKLHRASTGSSRGTRPSTEWRMPILSRRARKSSTRLGLQGGVRHPREVVTSCVPLVEPATELADSRLGVGRREGGEPGGAEAGTECVVVERAARHEELAVGCGSPGDVAPEPVDPALERTPGEHLDPGRRAPPDATVEPEVLHPAAVPAEELVPSVTGEEHLDPVRTARHGPRTRPRSRSGSPTGSRAGRASPRSLRRPRARSPGSSGA